MFWRRERVNSIEFRRHQACFTSQHYLRLYTVYIYETVYIQYMYIRDVLTAWEVLLDFSFQIWQTSNLLWHFFKQSCLFETEEREKHCGLSSGQSRAINNEASTPAVEMMDQSRNSAFKNTSKTRENCAFLSGTEKTHQVQTPVRRFTPFVLFSQNDCFLCLNNLVVFLCDGTYFLAPFFSKWTVDFLSSITIATLKSSWFFLLHRNCSGSPRKTARNWLIMGIASSFRWDSDNNNETWNYWGWLQLKCT